jgi:hypothetical protein
MGERDYYYYYKLYVQLYIYTTTNFQNKIKKKYKNNITKINNKLRTKNHYLLRTKVKLPVTTRSCDKV